MFQLDSHPSGRHFLQIPGPTNVPTVSTTQWISRPSTIGVRFAKLTLEILEVKADLQTAGPVIISGVGTGLGAALVNTLSAGDAC
jgi:alanine-glyoxylate transaminase/serine-glyoxylate transaminase/serine-pyruvate transaminase